MSSRSRRMRRVSQALALAALLGAPALLPLSGCEGTSSGVDNPGVAELTVGFRGEDGAALRVSGVLEVYGKDQNPAQNPAALTTVNVQASSFANLTAKDFERIQRALVAATKRSAAPHPVPSAAADGPVAFNLVFRGDARTGTYAFGLRYDPARKAFDRNGTAVSRLYLIPKALRRYQARMAREPVHGELGRVYIPGTPFQATLADSGFVFEALPEGVFPVRLVGEDGRIFAVRESLDTRAARTFTAGMVPVGRIDTTDTGVIPVRFQVFAGEDRVAVVDTAVALQASLLGLDSADPRLSVLWRQLKATTAEAPVAIGSPTTLATSVKFRSAGTYSIELAVTHGARTVRDTVSIRVREAPAPARPKVVQPRSRDTLEIGVQTVIAWEMPVPGLATLELSLLNGLDSWQSLAVGVPSQPGPNTWNWTPNDSLSPSRNCLIRVRLDPYDTSVSRDSLVAVMEGPFQLVPGPKFENPQ